MIRRLSEDRAEIEARCSGCGERDWRTLRREHTEHNVQYDTYTCYWRCDVCGAKGVTFISEDPFEAVR